MFTHTIRLALIGGSLDGSRLNYFAEMNALGQDDKHVE